jgi:hypothetical protein
MPQSQVALSRDSSAEIDELALCTIIMIRGNDEVDIPVAMKPLSMTSGRQVVQS